MTLTEEKEMIENLMEKLLDKGFDLMADDKDEYYNWYGFEYDPEFKIFVSTLIETEEGRITWDLDRIIFSHQFAKLVWGEGQNERLENGKFYLPQFGWRHHLMNMVLDENRISYLSRHAKL